MITNKKFKDKRTGEIVTQFNIMDIKHFEEVEEEDDYKIVVEGVKLKDLTLEELEEVKEQIIKEIEKAEKENFFMCSHCEKEISKEDDEGENGVCSNCLYGNENAYDEMRDNKIEEERDNIAEEKCEEIKNVKYKSII